MAASFPLRKVAAVVTVLALAAAGAYAYRSRQLLIVKVTPAVRGDLVLTVSPTETGTVESDRSALVKTETSGVVVAVLVEEGDRVASGQVLVRLDTATARQRVELAAATLTAARARLASARATLAADRVRAGAGLQEAVARRDDARQRRDKRRFLYEQRLVPSAEMESAEAELAVAEAALSGAQAGLDQLAAQERQLEALAAEVAQQEAAVRVSEQDLGRAEVRAPFAGTVMEVPIERGELALAGTPIARVTGEAGLYVRALVDEVDIARVRVGQTAELRFDVLPGAAVAGRVTEISPAVSTDRLKSRSVAVKVVPEKPVEGLRPGMSADVEIVVGRLASVLQVPAEAVMSRAGERFVYVLEGGRIAKRLVGEGLSNWESTEIRTGLRQGEAVVTSLDQEKLRPGARARAEGP